jgi:hypothetical protein
LENRERIELGDKINYGGTNRKRIDRTLLVSKLRSKEILKVDTKLNLKPNEIDFFKDIIWQKLKTVRNLDVPLLNYLDNKTRKYP